MLTRNLSRRELCLTGFYQTHSIIEPIGIISRSAIVLYVPGPQLTRHWQAAACPRAARKSATYRSLRSPHWQPWCRRQAHTTPKIELRLGADATSTRSRTGEYGNLVSKGIIDPTKVVRTALQDAASIAGTLRPSLKPVTRSCGSIGNPRSQADPLD